MLPVCTVSSAWVLPLQCMSSSSAVSIYWLLEMASPLLALGSLLLYLPNEIPSTGWARRNLACRNLNPAESISGSIPHGLLVQEKIHVVEDHVIFHLVEDHHVEDRRVVDHRAAGLYLLLAVYLRKSWT